MPARDLSDSPLVKILIAIVLIGSVGTIVYLSFWQSPDASVYAPEFQPELGRNHHRSGSE